jgi:wyosine [tRNA(Phe)-imidazoG37] synthetase (radical SAM superfamily)
MQQTTVNSGARGFEAHPRNWRNFRFCYPVISRRSRGLSLGINLNPDRVCNFDCVYCEVDRHDFRPGKGKLPLPPKDAPRLTVDLLILRRELRALLEMTRSGAIWQEAEFSTVSPALRRLNDIAFSGDGEPTTYPQFSEAVQAAIECRAASGFAAQDVKIVLITNATMFHRPEVRAGLQLMKEANGEIWAKLDAGTPEYYDLIDKTNVPYERILRNIETVARQQPLNVQTCMMRTHDMPPSEAEIEAYSARLNTILASGGSINAVQLYTVARRPPNEWVTSLTDEELNNIAAKISKNTGLPVEIFGGNVGL